MTIRKKFPWPRPAESGGGSVVGNDPVCAVDNCRRHIDKHSIYFALKIRSSPAAACPVAPWHCMQLSEKILSLIEANREASTSPKH